MQTALAATMFSPGGHRARSLSGVKECGSRARECLLDWTITQQDDRATMTFPRLQEPFRHILWATALAAALGAAYSQIQVYQRGGQPLAVYFLARGALTGAVIASVLTSFN